MFEYANPYDPTQKLIESVNIHSPSYISDEVNYITGLHTSLVNKLLEPVHLLYDQKAMLNAALDRMDDYKLDGNKHNINELIGKRTDLIKYCISHPNMIPDSVKEKINIIKNVIKIHLHKLHDLGIYNILAAQGDVPSFDYFHHAPMCGANHYHFTHFPHWQCTCGVRSYLKTVLGIERDPKHTEEQYRALLADSFTPIPRSYLSSEGIQLLEFLQFHSVSKIETYDWLLGMYRDITDQFENNIIRVIRCQDSKPSTLKHSQMQLLTLVSQRRTVLGQE